MGRGDTLQKGVRMDSMVSDGGRSDILSSGLVKVSSLFFFEGLDHSSFPSLSTPVLILTAKADSEHCCREVEREEREEGGAGAGGSNVAQVENTAVTEASNSDSEEGESTTSLQLLGT